MGRALCSTRDLRELSEWRSKLNTDLTWRSSLGLVGSCATGHIGYAAPFSKFYLNSICQPITPNAHPIKCHPQCPVTPFPFFLFPRVRSLSWLVSLSDTSPPSFPSFSFTISYSPHMNETIWLTDFTSPIDFSNWPISLSIIPSSSIHVEANGRYLSLLMAEEYSIWQMNG